MPSLILEHTHTDFQFIHFVPCVRIGTSHEEQIRSEVQRRLVQKWLDSSWARSRVLQTTFPTQKKSKPLLFIFVAATSTNTLTCQALYWLSMPFTFAQQRPWYSKTVALFPTQTKYSLLLSGVVSHILPGLVWSFGCVADGDGRALLDSFFRRLASGQLQTNIMFFLRHCLNNKDPCFVCHRGCQLSARTSWKFRSLLQDNVRV